jgi:hypothetical protein
MVATNARYNLHTVFLEEPFMNVQAVQSARLLGWAGIVPFILIPVIAYTGAPDWLESLLVSYGAIILAFMAGTLWARHVLIEQPSTRMLIASNVLALAAWPAVLMPLTYATGWLAVLFASHLMLDEPWRAHGLPGWYRRLRLALSLSVLVLLGLATLIGAGRVL